MIKDAIDTFGNTMPVVKQRWFVKVELRQEHSNCRIIKLLICQSFLSRLLNLTAQCLRNFQILQREIEKYMSRCQIRKFDISRMFFQ